MKEQLVLKKIIQNIVDICADIMKIDTIKINDANLKKNKIVLILNGNKKVSEPASSIYFLLKRGFQQTKGFEEEMLWQDEDPDTSIYSAIAYGKASKEMLKLTEFLYNEGEAEEARLCILQCDLDFIRYNPLGKKLFGKKKLEAEKISDSGSTSPTKLVENLIPLTNSKNVYEIIYAITIIMLYAFEGLFHFSGNRREKLRLALQKAEQDLKENTHPVIQIYSKIFSAKLRFIFKNIFENQ